MTTRDEWTAWALRARITAVSTAIGASAVKVVLVALCQYVDADGIAWPSAARLADDVGMDRRDVRNAFDVLTSAGLIERTEEVRRGRLVRWRVLSELAGYPATPMRATLAGSPANSLPVDNSGELAGELAGKLAGNMAGDPAMNENENENERSIQSVRSLQDARASFDLKQFRRSRPDLKMLSDTTINAVAAQTIGRSRSEVRDETAYVLKAANHPEWLKAATDLEWEEAIA